MEKKNYVSNYGDTNILTRERGKILVFHQYLYNKNILFVVMSTTFLFEVELNLVNIFKHFISDVDECQISSHNCSDNATCINTEGSFNCSCKPGYIGNGYNCTGWCSVANSFWLIFSLVFKYLLLQKKITKMFRLIYSRSWNRFMVLESPWCLRNNVLTK